MNDFLHAMVKAMTDAEAESNGIYTLGQLRDELETFPEDSVVVLEGPERLSLGELDSYRGYYDRLAFAPQKAIVYVAEVLQALNAADGEVYQGYKGGEFYMDEDTYMHVADYGSCGPYICGVEYDGPRRVLIRTKEEEW